MAGNTQAGVQEQLSADGPSLPMQLYVPASAVQGFAAPRGVDHAIDGTPTGHADTSVQLGRIPGAWHQSGVFTTSGTGGTVVQAAGGANTLILVYGFILTVFSAAAIWTAKVTCSTWLGPQTIYLSPQIASAGAAYLLPFLPPNPIEASAVNGGVTFTIANNAGGNLAATVNFELWGGIRQV